MGTHIAIVDVAALDKGGSSPEPLEDAWVYWRDGGTSLLLWSRGDEGLFQHSGDAPDDPEHYTEPFKVDVGRKVRVFYSMVGPPLPESVLEAIDASFVECTLETADVEGSPFDERPVASGAVLAAPAPRRRPRRPAPIAPANAGPGATMPPATPPSVNTLVAAPATIIVLPKVQISFQSPTDLTVWPLLWEPVSSAYATDGLSQGAPLFNGNRLTVAEGTAAPAPSSAVRPRSRGLRVRGTINDSVTSAKVFVDAAGATKRRLDLRDPAGAQVQELALQLGQPSGGERPFSADVFFNDPTVAMGAAVLTVSGVEGGGLTFSAGIWVLLVGVQLALVDDALAGADGASPGPVEGEADEKLVVDFVESPSPDVATQVGHARARRMIEHHILVRDRPYSATIATVVPKPQMPMWMAEVHLLGLPQGELERFLHFRRLWSYQQSARPTDLTFEASLSMAMSWRGPDAGPAATPRVFHYSDVFKEKLSVLVRLDAQRKIDGLSNGKLTNAFQGAPPTRPAFPVTTRRTAVVAVDASRPWGRVSGADSIPAMLIEWQPNIEGLRGSGQRGEVIRSGDAILALDSLTIDGVRVDTGVVATNSGPKIPPAGTPDAKLPAVRVIGANPPADLDAVVEVIVRELHATNPTPGTAFLTVDQWIVTVQHIIRHESRGQQFRLNPRYGGSSVTNRFSYRGSVYGEERGMPLFGPPHGYGIGQLDPPPSTNEVFSHIDNLRGAVRIAMVVKAADAWSAMHAHLTNDQRGQATFRREVVRRYNGFAEFRWTGTQFEISPPLSWANAKDPTKGANPNLNYPNQVLGTSIVYFTGSGAATTFYSPIAFPSSQFGPGI